MKNASFPIPGSLRFACLMLGAVSFAPAQFATARTAPRAAPYTIEETGRSYVRLQDAVDAIGAGTGTIRFASMRFADCAVQKAGSITYRAAVPGQSVLDGVPCQDKAALVLAGRSARVEGLVFANQHVSDYNGAGIRLERGDLAVSQSWFRDSQQGILANADPSASITIDKSTFIRLGTCDGSGGCAHSIYIGNFASLTVTRSRFEKGTGGHYVKHRGAKVAILDNSFDDTGGFETNYMIDLPNGSTGRIAGNWFVQGKSKDNHSAFIVVGANNAQHSSDGLTIEDNEARLAPGIDWTSNFVVDFTASKLVLRANKLDPALRPLDRR
jgi:hypothetical protein